MKRIAAALAATLLLTTSALATGPSTVTFPNQTPYGVTLDGSGAYHSTTALVDINNPALGATISGGSLQVAIPGNVTVVQGTAANLKVDLSGTAANGTSINVACTSGCGGSGGTSSNFAAAFPSAGTAIGAKNGANMVNLTADASNNLNVNLAANTFGTLTVNNTQQGTAAQNITQFGGTNISTGTGAGGTGVPRVTVSNDSNVLATQSGTWTVQPGNTANSTPWLVTTVPATTAGWTPIKESALSTTVATIKASAGELGTYNCANTNSTFAYIQVFDVSGTVTLGTTAYNYLIPLPPSSAGNVEWANGIHFANAIKVAATTTATGSTALTTALDCSFGFN